MSGVIYKIQCLVGEKRTYVGQHCTENPHIRWRQHVAAARRGADYPLYRAMRKYGVKNFRFDVIWCGPREQLNEKELHYIRLIGTLTDDVRGGGYNLSAIGGVGLTSQATRDKMRGAMQRLYTTDPSVRARVSAGTLAAMRADPSIQKRAAATRTGCKRSEETRRKLSENKRKFYAENPDKRSICGDTLRGKHLSAEHRQKLSAAAKVRTPRERSTLGTYV